MIWCRYYLYANTKLGFWYYKRELKKAKQKLNGLPHSLAEPFKQNGLCITLWHHNIIWVNNIISIIC